MVSCLWKRRGKRDEMNKETETLTCTYCKVKQDVDWWGHLYAVEYDRIDGDLKRFLRPYWRCVMCKAENSGPREASGSDATHHSLPTYHKTWNRKISRSKTTDF